MDSDRILALLIGLYGLHRRQVIRAYADGLAMGRRHGDETGLASARQRDRQNGDAVGHADGRGEGRRAPCADAFRSIGPTDETGDHNPTTDELHTLNAHRVGDRPTRSA